MKGRRRMAERQKNAAVIEEQDRRYLECEKELLRVLKYYILILEGR